MRLRRMSIDKLARGNLAHILVTHIPVWIGQKQSLNFEN